MKDELFTEDDIKSLDVIADSGLTERQICIFRHLIKKTSEEADFLLAGCGDASSQEVDVPS